MLTKYLLSLILSPLALSALGWCDDTQPRPGQRAEWDTERACWKGVDAPQGLPEALREMIRISQRDYGEALTARQTAYARMLVSDLGRSWQNLAQIVRERETQLLDLEKAAGEECAKRKLYYSSRLLTCVTEIEPLKRALGATEKSTEAQENTP